MKINHGSELGKENGAVVSPIPGVCVRVAGKGLTRQGVRKSGKQRTYKCASLWFLRRTRARGAMEEGGPGGAEWSRNGGAADGTS